MSIAAILELVSVLAPLATNVITIFKHQDGTTTVIAQLDAGDAVSAADKQQIQDWLTKHSAAKSA